ncbi:MAG: hypothetical protein ACYTKD_08670 [Planctomycetota bacterium]
MTGAGGGFPRTSLSYVQFLGPARPRTEFCSALSDTAPIEPGADVGSPAPFLESSSGPGRSATRHFLWPLFSQSRDARQRSFAFRPVVAAESRPGRKQVEVLWPVASYVRAGENVSLRIRPIFRYDRRVRRSGDQETDTDWWLFPILFGGSDTREGKYFAFFPLGGTLKGAFGKKKISFFLWPLWQKTEDLRYDAVHVAWPLLSYWKGKDQSGRRLWPFFAANRREATRDGERVVRFDRRTWLWPLFHYWRVGGDTRKPGEAFFFFPFFGRARNWYKGPDGEKTLYLKQTSVLFPFFHHVKRTRPSDKVNIRNIEEVQVPWPFLGYEKADGLVARKLWPIWGERKSNDLRDKFVLWPLYRRSIQHEADVEHRWHNVGVLFSSQLDRWVESPEGRRYPPPWPDGFKRMPDPRVALGLHKSWETRAGEVKTRRWAQLWPVFHYARDEHGAKRFQMLSLFPRRAAGAEALWRPFLTLYRFERDTTGQKRESFAFGLIRHTRRPEGDEAPGMRHVNLAGVVNYDRRSGVGRKWSILGGLIGYERVGGRRCYRFLWAPFGRIPREVRERYEGAGR